LVEVIILILAPKDKNQKLYKGNHQSITKRDLYSELMKLSMLNRQKHCYFKLFYQ